MKNRNDEIIKLARGTNLHFDEYQASKERTLKTNAKIARNRKLYLDGYSKGLQGISLESFTDLIEKDNEMIQRKDHPNFKAGYNAGCEAALTQNKGRTR